MEIAFFKRINYSSLVTVKSKDTIVTIIALLICFFANAQYVFRGSIENDAWNGEAYLSIVDDYRKISGVHSEQIISKTNIIDDFFEFKGNNLNLKNKIYRIHVDSCIDGEQSVNHFDGHCDNSQEILFVANNKDTIDLPISGDNQMFCSIQSTNKKSAVFFQIDSLRELMRYDYGNFRSEANRKLNNTKWFTTFQHFGEELNEPLAELYIYNFLSDRGGDLYGYYRQDLKSNDYYEKLLDRLKARYPNSVYTNQYEDELNADAFIQASKSQVFIPYTIILLVLSILLNFFFFYKLKKTKQNKKRNLTAQLTKQEQKIVELILLDKTNKEIASEIFVSLSTVKTHINNLYKKLNLQSREELKNLYNN